jgi:arginine decarboxylase
MGRIRVVWGTATGPTEMASYDAALAAANVHNYNLVSVSSVVPAGAAIEAVGEAPSLGPAGRRLTVVEARATVEPGAGDPAVACLGWAREPEGPGLFYEATGNEADAVRERVERGLEAGRELREWTCSEGGRRLVSADPDGAAYATAVVAAVYGESTPLL